MASNEVPAAATSSVSDKETSVEEPKRQNPVPLATSTNEKLEDNDIDKAQVDNQHTPDPPSISTEEKFEDIEMEKVQVENEHNPDYPTGFKLVTLIIALCLAVFLVALDQTIIATAIPKITDHFNSINDIGWYGSAYFLTSTSLQPSFGRIYKVFNVCLCPKNPYSPGSRHLFTYIPSIGANCFHTCHCCL
jgi:hypothetical protein